MTENYYAKREREAVEALDALLAMPPMPDDRMHSEGECFDPWDLFPCVYGSYSNEFDDLAIAVLSDINAETYERRDLAAEIFREMLCTTGFCDYGTSPRTCFATPAFKERLPQFVERWREYAQIQWKD